MANEKVEPKKENIEIDKDKHINLEVTNKLLTEISNKLTENKEIIMNKDKVDNNIDPITLLQEDIFGK